MGDEDDGPALAAELFYFGKALFLEGFIAHRQDLVHEHDIGVGMDGGGEGKAKVHAGGIVLELHVLEFFEFGEVEDVVVDFVHLLSAHAEDGGIDIDIVPGGELRLEANAELEEGGDPAVDSDCAPVRVEDFSQYFEQGGLARAVSADNTEGLAFFDLEADILKCPELFVFELSFDDADDVLEEGGPFFSGDAEFFGYVFSNYGRHFTLTLTLSLKGEGTIRRLTLSLKRGVLLLAPSP